VLPDSFLLSLIEARRKSVQAGRPFVSLLSATVNFD